MNLRILDGFSLPLLSMKFRLGGIELFLGYEAAAALTAALLLDHSGTVLCCFFAAVMHECGHLLMMRLFCCRLRSISITLFDVKICADEPKSVGADAMIASAGVMTNFFFAAVCYPFLPMMSLSHLAIGIFNLLPMDSLDGGRLLLLWLTRRLSAFAAERILKAVTFVFLTPILCCGIYVLLHTKYNYSLLAVSLYLLTVLLLQ